MIAKLPKNSFYVTSYPRSGNTWLINCLTMLFDGVRGEAYTPFKLYTELHGEPGPDFHFWCEPRRHPDQPICVKSHDSLPMFRTRHPKGPMVYIARDARDCLLSYYFFQQAYAQGEQLEIQRIRNTEVLISRGSSDPSFNADDFSVFLRKEAPLWLAHVQAARQVDRVCFLTYEKLTGNFEKSLRTVVQYLNLPVVRTYEETGKVYHHGFDSVFSGNNRDFFRQGRIGDWKNWYKPENVLLIDDLIGENLLDLGFEQDRLWASKHIALLSSAQ